MHDVQDALANLSQHLRTFCTQLQNDVSQLKRTMDSKPCADPSYLRQCLAEVSEQTTQLNNSIANLDSITVDALSFQELLGHARQLYRLNQQHITAVEDQLKQYGYEDGCTCKAPADPFDAAPTTAGDPTAQHSAGGMLSVDQDAGTAVRDTGAHGAVHAVEQPQATSVLTRNALLDITTHANNTALTTPQAPAHHVTPQSELPSGGLSFSPSIRELLGKYGGTSDISDVQSVGSSAAASSVGLSSLNLGPSPSTAGNTSIAQYSTSSALSLPPAPSSLLPDAVPHNVPQPPARHQDSTHVPVHLVTSKAPHHSLAPLNRQTTMPSEVTIISPLSPPGGSYMAANTAGGAPTPLPQLPASLATKFNTGGHALSAHKQNNKRGNARKDKMEALRDAPPSHSDDDSTVELYGQIIRRRSSPKPQRVPVASVKPRAARQDPTPMSHMHTPLADKPSSGPPSTAQMVARALALDKNTCSTDGARQQHVNRPGSSIAMEGSAGGCETTGGAASPVEETQAPMHDVAQGWKLVTNEEYSTLPSFCRARCTLGDLNAALDFLQQHHKHTGFDGMSLEPLGPASRNTALLNGMMKLGRARVALQQGKPLYFLVQE